MKESHRVQYANKQAGMSESDRASMKESNRVQYTKKQAEVSESERTSRNAKRRYVSNAAKSGMAVDEMHALQSRRRVNGRCYRWCRFRCVLVACRETGICICIRRQWKFTGMGHCALESVLYT